MEVDLPQVYRLLASLDEGRHQGRPGAVEQQRELLEVAFVTGFRVEGPGARLHELILELPEWSCLVVGRRRLPQQVQTFVLGPDAVVPARHDLVLVLSRHPDLRDDVEHVLEILDPPPGGHQFAIPDVAITFEGALQLDEVLLHHEFVVKAGDAILRLRVDIPQVLQGIEPSSAGAGH